MSASREKQNRQELANSGWTDPKLTQEAEQRKAEKRNNTLYAIIGIVFAVILIGSLVWRSNIIPRTATAATIDGEKYTAAEVNFYYQNTYNGFMNTYYYVLSYIGLDTAADLNSQLVNDTAASMLEVDAGITWKEYFQSETLKQMTMVQNGLKNAEAEGFVYPASVQAQYDQIVASLESAAASSGMSIDEYLKNNYGRLITEDVYKTELLRTLQFESYISAYEAGLTYGDAELEEAYKASKSSYDRVAYEMVSISGAVKKESEDDEDPTEEETEAAKKAAKEAANKMLDAFKAGTSLSSLADGNENATYAKYDAGAYTGDVVTAWLFDDARKSGDSTVLESGSTYYVVSYDDRFREEYNTINVRHILIQPAAGELAADAEGYEAEQEKLNAEAKAQAEDILAQWKAGEATEDSFAQLAQEYSVDGSKYDGGLYTCVYKGQMVSEFEDWCFDSSRKVGDTGIVETPYGFHIMFFSGEDLPRWQALVTTDLAGEDFNAYATELSEGSDVQRQSFGMKFVG